jgi:hypothetical protein
MQRGGAVALSFTPQHQGTQENEDQTGLESAPESEELSRNVLWLIGAYRMGAALDARDLFPRGSAPGSELAPAT